MKTKNVSNYLVLILSMLLFTCTEEEVADRSYLSLDTSPVTAINSGGATFNADLFALGFSGISDHGFVYDDAPDPTLEKSDKISLGERSAKGTFSSLANRNLVRNKKYSVRVYAIAKNNNILVYGCR